MASFSFIIKPNGTPALTSEQQNLVREFSRDYSKLFDSFEEACGTLGYFDQKDELISPDSVRNSCFHNKDYLERFCVNHYDAISHFIKQAVDALGPINDFPDERLDNMFGDINFERDDFAFAKFGKIGVHIAGKLLNDNKLAAEQYLEIEFNHSAQIYRSLK